VQKASLDSTCKHIAHREHAVLAKPPLKVWLPVAEAQKHITAVALCFRTTAGGRLHNAYHKAAHGRRCIGDVDEALLHHKPPADTAMNGGFSFDDFLEDLLRDVQLDRPTQAAEWDTADLHKVHSYAVQCKYGSMPAGQHDICYSS